eukprot:tig00021612_g22883.t1
MPGDARAGVQPARQPTAAWLSEQERERYVKLEEQRLRQLRLKQVREQDRLFAASKREKYQQLKRQQENMVQANVLHVWEARQIEETNRAREELEEAIRRVGASHMQAAEFQASELAAAHEQQWRWAESRAAAQERYRNAMTKVEAERVSARQVAEQTSVRRAVVHDVEAERSAIVVSSKRARSLSANPTPGAPGAPGAPSPPPASTLGLITRGAGALTASRAGASVVAVRRHERSASPVRAATAAAPGGDEAPQPGGWANLSATVRGRGSGERDPPEGAAEWPRGGQMAAQAEEEVAVYGQAERERQASEHRTRAVGRAREAAQQLALRKARRCPRPAPSPVLRAAPQEREGLEAHLAAQERAERARRREEVAAATRTPVTGVPGRSRSPARARLRAFEEEFVRMVTEEALGRAGPPEPIPLDATEIGAPASIGAAPGPSDGTVAHVLRVARAAARAAVETEARHAEAAAARGRLGAAAGPEALAALEEEVEGRQAEKALALRELGRRAELAAREGDAAARLAREAALLRGAGPAEREERARAVELLRTAAAAALAAEEASDRLGEERLGDALGLAGAAGAAELAAARAAASAAARREAGASASEAVAAKHEAPPGRPPVARRAAEQQLREAPPSPPSPGARAGRQLPPVRLPSVPAAALDASVSSLASAPGAASTATTTESPSGSSPSGGAGRTTSTPSASDRPSSVPSDRDRGRTAAAGSTASPSTNTTAGTATGSPSSQGETPASGASLSPGTGSGGSCGPAASPSASLSLSTGTGSRPSEIPSSAPSSGPSPGPGAGAGPLYTGAAALASAPSPSISLTTTVCSSGASREATGYPDEEPPPDPASLRDEILRRLSAANAWLARYNGAPPSPARAAPAASHGSTPSRATATGTATADRSGGSPGTSLSSPGASTPLTSLSASTASAGGLPSAAAGASPRRRRRGRRRGLGRGLIEFTPGGGRAAGSPSSDAPGPALPYASPAPEAVSPAARPPAPTTASPPPPGLAPAASPPQRPVVAPIPAGLRRPRDPNVPSPPPSPYPSTAPPSAPSTPSTVASPHSSAPSSATARAASRPSSLPTPPPSGPRVLLSISAQRGGAQRYAPLEEPEEAAAAGTEDEDGDAAAGRAGPEHPSPPQLSGEAPRGRSQSDSSLSSLSSLGARVSRPSAGRPPRSPALSSPASSSPSLPSAGPASAPSPPATPPAAPQPASGPRASPPGAWRVGGSAASSPEAAIARARQLLAALEAQEALGPPHADEAGASPSRSAAPGPASRSSLASSLRSSVSTAASAPASALPAAEPVSPQAAIDHFRRELQGESPVSRPGSEAPIARARQLLAALETHDALGSPPPAEAFASPPRSAAPGPASRSSRSSLASSSVRSSVSTAASATAHALPAATPDSPEAAIARLRQELQAESPISPISGASPRAGSDAGPPLGSPPAPPQGARGGPVSPAAPFSPAVPSVTSAASTPHAAGRGEQAGGRGASLSPAAPSAPSAASAASTPHGARGGPLSPAAAAAASAASTPHTAGRGAQSARSGPLSPADPPASSSASLASTPRTAGRGAPAHEVAEAAPGSAGEGGAVARHDSPPLSPLTEEQWAMVEAALQHQARSRHTLLVVEAALTPTQLVTPPISAVASPAKPRATGGARGPRSASASSSSPSSSSSFSPPAGPARAPASDRSYLSGASFEAAERAAFAGVAAPEAPGSPPPASPATRATEIRRLEEETRSLASDLARVYAGAGAGAGAGAAAVSPPPPLPSPESPSRPPRRGPSASAASTPAQAASAAAPAASPPLPQPAADLLAVSSEDGSDRWLHDWSAGGSSASPPRAASDASSARRALSPHFLPAPRAGSPSASDSASGAASSSAESQPLSQHLLPLLGGEAAGRAAAAGLDPAEVRRAEAAPDLAAYLEADESGEGGAGDAAGRFLRLSREVEALDELLEAAAARLREGGGRELEEGLEDELRDFTEELVGLQPALPSPPPPGSAAPALDLRAAFEQRQASFIERSRQRIRRRADGSEARRAPRPSQAAPPARSRGADGGASESPPHAEGGEGRQGGPSWRPSPPSGSIDMRAARERTARHYQNLPEVKKMREERERRERLLALRAKVKALDEKLKSRGAKRL